MTVTINNEQRLFVIPCNGGGYTCMGFDVVYNHVKKIAEALDLTAPFEADIGKIEQYTRYRNLVPEWAAKFPTKTYFDPGTDKQVEQLLESARINGTTLRIFYGDKETGRDWMEENDVAGRIGRSTGMLKVPLMIIDNANGGAAILTHCIVRIVTKGGKELYRHPKYAAPDITLTSSTVKGYTTAAIIKMPDRVNVLANFRSPGKAQRWVDFMTGRRVTA